MYQNTISNFSLFKKTDHTMGVMVGRFSKITELITSNNISFKKKTISLLNSKTTKSVHH